MRDRDRLLILGAARLLVGVFCFAIVIVGGWNMFSKSSYVSVDGAMVAIGWIVAMPCLDLLRGRSRMSLEQWNAMSKDELLVRLALGAFLGGFSGWLAGSAIEVTYPAAIAALPQPGLVLVLCAVAGLVQAVGTPLGGSHLRRLD